MKRIIVIIMLLLSLTGCSVSYIYNITPDVVNDAMENAVGANVRVNVLATSGANFWAESGSGVIFDECDDYYYILTNYHVVEKKVEGSDVVYTISDYKGVEYNGEIVLFEKQYDLAVVRIEKINELVVLKLASGNVGADQDVIAMGQPSGQINALTLGVTSEYVESPEINGYKVSGYVLEHSAPIKNGSSGGALINHNHEIVGINYAVYVSDDGAFIKTLAIPITSIKEVISKNYK